MKKATVLAALLASLALIACGGGDDDDGGGGGAAATGGGGGDGGGQTLKIGADPGGALEFDIEEATAQAGNLTIEFTNPSSLQHDVVVEQDGNELGRTPLVSEGTETATIKLKPGEYRFYCSVPGHAEGGMEGTLTVE